MSVLLGVIFVNMWEINETVTFAYARGNKKWFFPIYKLILYKEVKNDIDSDY